MEPDSPILPGAAGSLPASSPSRKGVKRLFAAGDHLLADRLDAGLFGIGAQGRDAGVVASGGCAVRLRTRYQRRPMWARPARGARGCRCGGPGVSPGQRLT